MFRTSDILKRFQSDDSGAVTVDWVVLTAAIVGLGIAVTASTGSGAATLGDKISQALGALDVTQFGAGSEAFAATHYFDLGLALSPDNQTEAWRQARMAVQEDAPAGYNYDPEFDETRYVDAETGMPVYESDDGQSYSIGGEIVSAADYNPASEGASFMSTFNGYARS